MFETQRWHLNSGRIIHQVTPEQAGCTLLRLALKHRLRTKSRFDSGFAVKDHYKIDAKLGNWSDIKSFSKKSDVMADIVINHSSARGLWFKNFLKAIYSSIINSELVNENIETVFQNQ